MNVKIQGSGNGTYANTGSCVAVTNYLQHEDLERMKKGEEVQPFFNQFRRWELLGGLFPDSLEKQVHRFRPLVVSFHDLCGLFQPPGNLF